MNVLKQLAKKTVTFAPKTGSDDYGNSSFGTQQAYESCRVERESKTITDENGDEVVTTGVIYVVGADATGDANPGGRAYLPGADTGDPDTAETVIRSRHLSNPDLGEHTKVWF